MPRLTKSIGSGTERMNTTMTKCFVTSPWLAVCLVALGPLTIGRLHAQQSSPLPEQNINDPHAFPGSSTGGFLPSWVQSVLAEIRSLRIEMLQYRLELMAAKVPILERELEQARIEQQVLDEEQRSEAQEISSIDSHLNDVAVEPAEREDLETRRNALVARAPVRFRTGSTLLVQREAQAREELARHQQRMQVLLEQARRLTPVAQDGKSAPAGGRLNPR
jgi:hypothetical protein